MPKKYDKCLTLVELLRQRAERSPERLAYAYLLEGELEEASLTYAGLDLKARVIAAALQTVTRRGRRALLLYPPGLTFLPAFLGCLYAGVIAVPVYPPRNPRHMPRLHTISREAEAGLVLTTADLLPKIRSWAGQPGAFEDVRLVSTDDLDAGTGRNWCDPVIKPDDLAFLQYTSGSTSTPKGVMVSHANLIHNLGCLKQAFDLSEESVSVSWMPHFHDMGLIEGQLQPLFGGFPAYLMAPVAFIQQPFRWLQAISRYRATHSSGPNFAFELCIRKITPVQRDTLDLSCWNTALNGAEPVRAVTVEHFARTFAPCGFKPSAHRPSYGLAESTLFVSSTGTAAPPGIAVVQSPALERGEIVPSENGNGESRKLVGCGPVSADTRIAIVDPEQFIECAGGRVGEIWLAGPSIAQGYWQQPDATRETFRAFLSDTGEGPFLRTGDLGFVREDGTLFVTGRLKDLIIVAGANHYPQDIELTVENSHPALQPDAGAALAFDEDGEERLVIVQEVKRSYRRDVDPAAVFASVSAAVAREHELQVDRLLLLSPGTIPKTSSGKIQRSACRHGAISGELSILGRWSRLQGIPSSPSAQHETPATSDARRDRRGIRAWLTVRIGEQLGVAPDALSTTRPLAEYGLVSRDAIGLTGDLEDYLGIRLSPTFVYRHPTIEAIADALASSAADTIRPLSPAPDCEEAEPVAVIGIGCRFPGASGPSAFWKLLDLGVDAIGEVPPDRWIADACNGSGGCSRWGGFIQSPGDFDAAFFGISRREADGMDPQQRLLLEVSWEALEHAGLPAHRLAGSRTGVFVGISTEDYARLQAEQGVPPDAYRSTGTAFSIAANRLSYCFDLRGPSMAVDTACSSSLVAVHQACRCLRAGEADLALAAGVNLLLSPELGVAFSRSGMMASDGRCRSFDAEADGYVRGEGCGVVVLKPLSRAIADGDTVWALILGSAVNQDGRSNGLTAPSGDAQQAVIREALDRARIEACDIDFVEAHGTGTPLGDPIEVEALNAVFGADRRPDARLRIGSVKTNIGHLEAAAGIAGLIKSVLALHHRRLPASLHLRRLNPHLAWDKLGVRVATHGEPLAAEGRPLRAGVSSFGFGGTNAHVVLEQAPAVNSAAEKTKAHPPYLIPVSAADGKALTARIRSYRNRLEEAVSDPFSIQDLAHTLGCRTSHLSYRRCFIARDREKLHGLFTEALDTPGGLESVRAVSGKRPKLAMVFADPADGWVEMGRTLLDRHPVFREIMQRMDEAVAQEAGFHVLEALAADDPDFRLARTGIAQPVIFALQAALTALWRSWGVAVEGVIGCGMGELAAAHAAGALDLKQAVRIIVRSAHVMEAAAGMGNPLEALAAELQEALGEVRFAEPALPFYSAATGSCTGPALPVSRGADHWARTLGGPGRFPEAVQAMLAAGFDLFLEIGPQPALPRSLRDCIEANGGSATLLASFRPHPDPLEVLLESLGALYTRGVPVDWEAISPAGRLLSLPAYPWQRERHWFRPEDGTRAVFDTDAAWERVVTAADRQSRSGPFDLALQTYPVKWKVLERLSLAYRVDCLRRLGAFAAPGERQTADTLRTRFGIKDSYRILLGRWLDSLAAEGLLRREENRFVAPQPLPEPELDPLLEEARRALSDIPFLLDYLNRCGNLLPEVLTGRVSALETLIPDASFSTVEQLYHGWSVARYFNCIASAALGSWISTRSADAPLRILELGAGTGGMSRALIPELPLRCSEYRFTDVSEFFFERVKEKLKAYPFVRYSRLDIEEDPLAQGFSPHGFDVVIGANVLHATRDLTQTLRHVRSLMAEDGLLLLYEVTRAFPWLDISTALIEGWQRFEGDLRQDSPLLPADAWRDVLGRTGFLSPTAFPAVDSPAAILGQHVIAARAPQPEAPGSRRTLAQTATPAAAGTADWLYELAWEDRPIPPRNGEAIAGTWLILADRGGVGEILTRFLRERGARPIGVFPAESFAHSGEDRFTVRPDCPGDLRMLLEGSPVGSIAGIVHLWSLDAADSDLLDPEGLDWSRRIGVESVVHLVQAMRDTDGSAASRIWFVTRGSQATGSCRDTVAVSQAPLWGLARVIANERPQAFGGLVDLESGEAARTSAVHLLDEISRPSFEQIAYRAGRRYVARLRRHRAASSAAGLRISPQGAYLITGGLGALGLRMAGRLAAQGARHLVLLGRTPLPPRTEWECPGCDPSTASRIAGIRALEAHGVTVRCAACDVADPAALEDLLTSLGREDARPIRGVVHAAGLLEACALPGLTAEALRRMWQAKVIGAWLLHKHFDRSDLDFFILFSSASSVLAPPGHGAYASANAFLDALAHYRRQQGLPAVSIGWGVWEDAGAAARSVVDRFEREEMARIDSATGLNLAERLAAGDTAHVVVLPGDLTQWLRFVPELEDSPLLQELTAGTIRFTPASEKMEAVSLLRRGGEESREHIVQHLVEAVASVLRADPVRLSTERSLLEMGLDSLMAVGLKNRIETTLGVDIPVAKLLEGLSIHEAAAYIVNRVTDDNRLDLKGTASDEREIVEI